MFASLIRRIGRVLDSQDLPYMIIGGQAVLLYGTPRLTNDIDITLGIDTREIEKVLRAVKSIGLELILRDLRPFVEETQVLPTRDRESGIRVDFIFSFTPYERQAIARARAVPLGSASVTFAAIEDVIIHKIFAGRPRDLEDVRSMAIKNPGIDKDYVRRWLAEFQGVQGKERLLQTFEEILSGIRGANDRG